MQIALREPFFLEPIASRNPFNSTRCSGIMPHRCGIEGGVS
jgi:hypothetical protein